MPTDPNATAADDPHLERFVLAAIADDAAEAGWRQAVAEHARRPTGETARRVAARWEAVLAARHQLDEIRAAAARDGAPLIDLRGPVRAVTQPPTIPPAWAAVIAEFASPEEYLAALADEVVAVLEPAADSVTVER